MAKKHKRGLGRGLDSLLGVSYNEATPQRNNNEKDAVEVEKNVEKPANNRVMVDGGPEVKIIQNTGELNTSKQDATYNPLEGQTPESINENGETVTIKGVVEREVKQQTIEPETEKNEAESPQNIETTDEVPVDEIVPNPNQPRTNFDKEELEELASSIKKNGLLQPILVRSQKGGKYEIIAGERRWQASKLAGLEKIPIRIQKADDDKALELALIENIQRSDLNPIEEAYGYKRMMERLNMTQADVAQAVSKGRSTVANALRLLELPEDAQHMLFENKITAGHARAILSIPEKEGRESLTKKLAEMKMSVRETEAIARLFAGKASGTTKTRKPIPKEYKKVARTLKDVLNTGVRVKSANGKNKIEIEFKDEEDLERLFKGILSANVG